MQGILYTGMAAVRDQMRRAGVFNPMDAGAAIDQETGSLVDDQDHRKRARVAAMSMLNARGRELTSTQAGVQPPFAVVGPGGAAGGDAGPHMGVVVGAGAGAAPVGAPMAFVPWGEPERRNGFDFPGVGDPGGFEDEYAIFLGRLRDFLFPPSVVGLDVKTGPLYQPLQNMIATITLRDRARVDVGELNSGPHRVTSYRTGLLERMHLLRDAPAGGGVMGPYMARYRIEERRMLGLPAPKVVARNRNFSTVLDGGACCANPVGVSIKAIPHHVALRLFQHDTFEVLGGNIVSGAMAVHLARWPGVTSMDDENVSKLVKLVSCEKDIDFMVYLNTLIGVCEGNLHREVGMNALSTIAYLYGMLDLRKTPRKGMTEEEYGGGLIKAALCQIRSHVSQLWEDSEGMTTFAEFTTMPFADWMQGLYTLLGPCRKKERIVNVPDIGKLSGDDYVVFESVHDFYARVLEVVRVDVVRLTGYSREILSRAPEYDLYRRAQALDYYYACLVRGAAVKVNVERVWTSGQPPVPELLSDSKFINIVWKVVERLQPDWVLPGNVTALGAYRPGGDRRQIASAVQHMRDIRDAMVEIWTESKSFRVSDEVHMVEIQVLQRLKRDGLIAWFDSAPHGTALGTLHVCHWFRRHESVRDQFAMTVGKRMATESLVSTHNQSITAHQRTVNWAEREYMALYAKVSDLSAHIADHCDVPPADLERRIKEDMYVDYTNMLHSNAQRDRGEEAVYAASRGQRLP